MEVSAALSRTIRAPKLITTRFYIVYVVWLAIETTIIFFLYPETKGKPRVRPFVTLQNRANSKCRTYSGGAFKAVRRRPGHGEGPNGPRRRRAGQGSLRSCRRNQVDFLARTEGREMIDAYPSFEVEHGFKSLFEIVLVVNIRC